MSQNVAPWLQGLDDEESGWEAPVLSMVAPTNTHPNASSIRSLAHHRSPLTTLSNSNTISNANSLPHPRDSLKLAQSRSFSGGSDDSVLQHGTVQQRSKSASPTKQHTLEWKKRLLRGQVGYGDHTDLFGPSGLENIFAPSRPAETSKKTRGGMAWMERSAAVAMPSSPPPWPSTADTSYTRNEEDSTLADDRLPAVHEENATESELPADDSALRSDPYELDHSELPQYDESEQGAKISTSPERPLADTTHDKIEGNRTVSGQTDVDDFSPVFVSKHHTLTGQIEYKALDSRTIKNFKNMTLNLKPTQRLPSTRYAPFEHAHGLAVEESVFTDGPESEALPVAPEVPDFSLSEDLPTGTPPIAGLGNNVQLRRGGYSQNGSFKHRPLSASQSTAGRSVPDDASGFLSPNNPTKHKSPSILSPNHEPATPNDDAHYESRSRSSGSPLKLFGPHDTFTSNRLWRRMSQLDPDLSAIRSEDASDLQETDQHASGPAVVQRSVSKGSFGNGELDAHAFNAEITITSASDSDKENSDGSPCSDVLPPGSKMPLGFRNEDAPNTYDTFRLKRKVSKRSDAGSKQSTLDSATTYQHPTVEDGADSMLPAGVGLQDQSEPYHAAGKRPPNSPSKAPTPKRRRTLHAQELENEVSEMSRSYHNQLQEAVCNNNKRRDSRSGEGRAIAGPEVLALRKILRPRNPTPNQRLRDQIEAEIRETAEQFAAQEPAALEAVMEQIESSMVSGSPSSIQQQANVVASEVAKFSLRIQKASGDQTERKRSVTTQDFFNEAVMVMRLIREKAGRHSVLGSVAESGQDVEETANMDNSGQEVSSLRLSRPPSREGGGSGWRPRKAESTDARVISHLRRFAERDDTEFIAESEASVHAEEEAEQIVAVDESSNIRIRGPLPTRNVAEDVSRPSTQHSQQSSVASQTSHNSVASCTGETFISRKSDHVGCLAPESVAHLIGEQVGPMTYDKDRQQWVKAKSPFKSQYGSFLEPPSNITSEDDPFREISDLQVDEGKEEEIRKASTGRRTSAQPLESQLQNFEEPADIVQQNPEFRTTSQETVLARPETGYSNQSHHTYSSSDPSRYTALASSQQQMNETRATSWGNEELQRLAAQGPSKQQPLAYAAAQAALALTQRHVSIAAPLREVQELQESAPEDNNDCEREESAENTVDDAVSAIAGLPEDTTFPFQNGDIEDLDSPKLRHPPNSTLRGGTRQVSLRRKTLTSRFNDAETMEQSELSFVAPLPGERMMSVSLSVSRPMSKRQPMGHISNLQSSPSKHDPSFMLSDLPEFTVHEEDQERPSEKALAQRLARHAVAESDDRYALAVRDLVKTLTDVKEGEPYWEDMKQLDLHGRGLASIHGLDQFCESVQEMDLSDNQLQYLNGAPTTIRQLVARENQLSSLTSWAHLMNLQYLDISGNHLQNFDGLSCLFHLRELRADDNDISCLNGITQLDGLLKLRARRNQLSALDLGDCRLQRLEELDLCENSITSMYGLESLQSLKSIKLDGNILEEPLQVYQEMSNLKHVSLKDCGLQQLNIAGMPYLRELIVDGNALSTIENIEIARSLDLLSMRGQSLPTGHEITIMEQAIHARTVRLSENTISSLRMTSSLLSTQHLEIASVGLQMLPDDFGLFLPNLITLNLNFNFLQDIRPLLNIQKLEHLSVCGNKLERLRKTVLTLSKLPTLTSVDLRENNLTQAFYAPRVSAQPQTSIVRRTPPQTDEDENQKAERLTVARYILPPGSAEEDRVHHTRLDNDTRLRRRVYHLLLGNSCHSLSQVDGLAFDKVGAKVRDKTWDRLIELGIVRKSGAVGMRNEDQTP